MSAPTVIRGRLPRVHVEVAPRRALAVVPEGAAPARRGWVDDPLAFACGEMSRNGLRVSPHDVRRQR